MRLRGGSCGVGACLDWIFSISPWMNFLPASNACWDSAIYSRSNRSRDSDPPPFFLCIPDDIVDGVPHTCDRIDNSMSSLAGKGEIDEKRSGPLD